MQKVRPDRRPRLAKRQCAEILWKAVVKSAADQQSFRERAEEFVKQLQEAAKPKNALEGLLLDRMASSYLRKVLLLEGEGEYKEHRRREAGIRKTGPTSESAVGNALMATLPSSVDSVFQGIITYEASLDRGFHRDTFLLLQLQQLSEQSAAISQKKPPQSASQTIEGDIEKPSVG